MTELACVPDPSSLLWDEQLSLRAQDLRDECQDVLTPQTAGQRRTLETIYHESQDLGEQAEAGERAILLLLLSDIARMEGKLGHALKYGREAAQIVRALPAVEYRHNYAVALYSLGLTCQLLGMDVEALDYYEQAQQNLKDLCAEWKRTPQNASTKKFQRHCDCLIPRIQQLRDYLSHARRCGGTSAILTPILVSRWAPENLPPKAEQILLQAKVKSITMEIRISQHGSVPSVVEAEIPLDREEVRFIVLDERLAEPKFVGEDDLNEESIGDVIGFFKAA